MRPTAAIRTCIRPEIIENTGSDLSVYLRRSFTVPTADGVFIKDPLHSENESEMSRKQRLPSSATDELSLNFYLEIY